jgi:transposase
MDCPICGAIAEQTQTTIDSKTIVCPRCGEFDVASSVIATGQLRKLEADQRADVLDRARRSVQPGARPVITLYLLA